MKLPRSRADLLRPKSGHDDRVSFVELFFDLVFVFAITRLSHALLEDFTPAGAGRTAMLLLAVWWVWIYTAWAINWLDPHKTAVRLMLFAMMLLGLVMSASIPEAFGARGLAFALAYVAMQVGRCVFLLWALADHNSNNFRNFQRITSWLAFAGLFWIAGGFAGGERTKFICGIKTK